MNKLQWNCNQNTFFFHKTSLENIICEMAAILSTGEISKQNAHEVKQFLSRIGAALLTKITWWRHQMETFSALLAICAGNSPVTGEFPTQRPVTRSFDLFFGLRLNKRLRKQSWGWWSETLSRPLWRQCNELRLGHAWVILCRELVCITVKWTWYNGRDIFFHITSGRINTCKGVNQLKELFFLNLIIIF